MPLIVPVGASNTSIKLLCSDRKIEDVLYVCHRCHKTGDLWIWELRGAIKTGDLLIWELRGGTQKGSKKRKKDKPKEEAKEEVN